MENFYLLILAHAGYSPVSVSCTINCMCLTLAFYGTWQMANLWKMILFLIWHRSFTNGLELYGAHFPSTFLWVVVVTIASTGYSFRTNGVFCSSFCWLKNKCSNVSTSQPKYPSIIWSYLEGLYVKMIICMSGIIKSYCAKQYQSILGQQDHIMCIQQNYYVLLPGIKAVPI